MAANYEQDLTYMYILLCMRIVLSMKENQTAFIVIWVYTIIDVFTGSIILHTEPVKLSAS